MAALVLAAPLLAMQVTDQVDWSVTDFLAFGVMLAVAGGLLELGARSRNLAYRSGVAVAAGAGFLLVWASLAVGVVGDGGRADLMYAGVLLIAAIGAVVARFRASGMARALFAAALAQAATVPLALAAGLAPMAAAPQLAGVSALFVALFVASALLFRKAARERLNAEPAG